MKNKLYLLVLTLLFSIGSASAQSTCASMVKNIGLEKRAGNIEYVTKISESTVLFYATDQYSGHELWRTDGTPQGTVLVKDIAPGTRSSRRSYPWGSSYRTATINKPVVLNGIMYFEANDNVHGFEVWRSDGTSNGTFMLKELIDKGNYDNSVDIEDNQNERFFYNFNNEVYFWSGTISKSISEFESTTLFRLFKTKGTLESTELVGEFDCDRRYTPKLFEFNDDLCFVTITPTSIFRPRKNPLNRISNVGRISQVELHPDGITNIDVVNGQLYFNNSKGLYKSDGTTESTTLVRESGSFFATSSISGYWGDGKIVYFLNNSVLWRTDGTMTGTFTLRSNLYSNFFLYKNELHFLSLGTTDNSSHGIRLWKTNGTVAGTIPIVDIDPDNRGYRKNIDLITEIDGFLYFYGKIEGVTADIEANSGIWKSNGTQIGSKVLCPLGPNLACQLINPSLENYGFVALKNSLLFLGLVSGFVENYGDAELHRTNLTNCPAITATITGTAAFCQGASTVFSTTATGGTAPYTYRWQQGTTVVGTGATTLTVNTAGEYTITATDANGCAGTAQVTVTQRTAPVVSIPATASFCTGQTVTLTAQTTGGTGPYTYAWRQSGASVGTSAGTLSVNAGGTYAVSVTDASGCASTSATTTLTQRPSPTATLTASAPGVIGGSSSVTLTASAGAGQSYQWTRDGQPIAGATQATYTTPQPGVYAVVVSLNGCSATAQATTISLLTAVEDPLSGPDFTLSASPNPGAGAVQVRITTQPGRTVAVTVSVRDLTGRSLYQKQLSVTGQHTEQLDLTAQPAAIYLLNATSNGQQTSLRLLRQ